MPNYREKGINSVQDFISLVEKEKNKAERIGNKADFIFRGQRRDWPLLPKLARPELKLKGKMMKIERLILEEFDRLSYPLSEFTPENDWDLIALAQHYGLPTRLLDWTYNALAGLYFAVRKSPIIDKYCELEDGVVWIFMPETEDFNIDTRKTTPYSNKITKIFRPKAISRRIPSQAAIFTVHKINENDRVIKLERHQRFSRKLIKVIIPAEAFPSIRQRLDTLGVNDAILFPDLDGLCRHLEWRYSHFDGKRKQYS